MPYNSPCGQEVDLEQLSPEARAALEAQRQYYVSKWQGGNAAGGDEDEDVDDEHAGWRRQSLPPGAALLAGAYALCFGLPTTNAAGWHHAST